jgi:copper transport protein
VTRRVVAVFALAALALGLAASSAFAHATLERSTPERGAVLDRAPRHVSLEFDEPVEAAFGAVRVFDGRGSQVPTGPVRRSGTTVAVGLPALADGAYTVTYRVISADGHPVSGGLTFQVGDEVTAPPQEVAALLEGTSAGPVTHAALGIARGLGYLAIAVGIGGLAFRLLCCADAPVMPLVAGAIALGVVAGTAAIVLQAAIAGGTTAWSALDPSVVREVLGTRTGGWLGVRVVAWIVLGVGLLLPVRWLAAIPAAVLVAGPALAGHATAQAPVAVLAPLDVVHVAASSLWIGGLVALLLAMPLAVRRLEAPAHTRLLSGALARFSSLALWSVLALAATGAVQAVIHLDWSLAPLTDTGFGRALLVKTALLALLVGAGALQRRRILPALRAHAEGGEAPGGAGRLLRRALRAEVVLVLGALAVSAILAGSPPPRAAAASAGPFSADVAIGPQQLQLTVDPALAGANEVHLYLLDARTGAPFMGSKELRIDAALPAKAIGPLRLDARPAGPGHWVVAGAPLAPAGTWRIRVTNRVSEFDEYETKVEVPVR